MIHIKIEGPSMDYELDVDASDVVDETLEVYSEDVDDPQESQHYEPAFIIGEAIPLNKGKTFAECGIKTGDTLYHLLGMAKEDILIPDELATEDVRLPAPHPGTSSQGNTIPARKMKIHIIQTEVEYERSVLQTSVVDPILEEYAVTLNNPTESCYYEPTFMIGEDLLADIHKGRRETFAQRGMRDGDTIYVLLRDRRYIVIQNEFKNGQKTPFFCSIRITIATVKELLQQKKKSRVDSLPTQDLALKFGDELLDESKTLDDYNMLKESKIHIHLCLKLQISIGLLKYTKLERVLFQPGDKIEDVKNEVLSKMPNIEYAAKVRESYPVPLRTMVNVGEEGTTSCIYLDVFSDEMEMFVVTYDKENNLAHDFKCMISCESTLTDICGLIRTQYDDPQTRNCRRIKRWPPAYAFNCAWMQTFAPQIEAKPLSSSTEMSLFFFPLCVEIVRSVRASPPTIQAEDFAITFCKEELGLEGVQRLIYHPGSDGFLKGSLLPQLDKLRSDGESYSVLLMKPRKRVLLGKRTSASEYITVKVQWPRSTAVEYEVKLTDTINILNDEIERHIQVPLSIYILMFDGELLEGNGTFAGMEIKDRSILDVIPLRE